MKHIGHDVLKAAKPHRLSRKLKIARRRMRLASAYESSKWRKVETPAGFAEYLELDVPHPKSLTRPSVYIARLQSGHYASTGNVGVHSSSFLKPTLSEARSAAKKWVEETYRSVYGDYTLGIAQEVRQDSWNPWGKTSILSAQEMLRREYGSSRNLMTPHILGRGKIGDRVAYELSTGTGTGIDHEPIFGVTVVRQWADGTIERWYDKSKMFHSREEAERHIEDLRKEVRELEKQYSVSAASRVAKCPSCGSTKLRTVPIMHPTHRRLWLICEKCGSREQI